MYWKVFTYDAKKSKGTYGEWLETLLRNLRAEIVHILDNQQVLVRFPEEWSEYDNYGNLL